MLVESPCIGVCHISKEHQFCEGCFRSEEEISKWITLSDEQKKRNSTISNSKTNQSYFVLINNFFLYSHKSLITQQLHFGSFAVQVYLP